MRATAPYNTPHSNSTATNRGVKYKLSPLLHHSSFIAVLPPPNRKISLKYKFSTLEMSAPTTHTTEMPSNSSTSENVTSGLAASTSEYNNGVDDNTSSTTNTGTKKKTEAEIAADKLYEERIEDEYAKREGGV